MRPLLLSALLSIFPLLALGGENLLLNPDFRFTSFDSLRTGKGNSRESGSVPFWESNGYDKIRVVRAPAVEGFRPKFPVEAAVRIEPGGTLSQWILLSESGLEPEDTVSLAVDGFQPEGAALTVQINAVMTDAEKGTWNPKAFGQVRDKEFPKAARGELLPRELAAAKAGAGAFEVRLDEVKLPKNNGPEAPQCVAVEIRFSNPGEAAVWVYAPRLVAGAKAPAVPVAGRPLPETYRSLPRTVTKLHVGEPLHILVLGSSIDRASANPSPYRYDEDPASPTFKQPLSQGNRIFNGEEVGRPELTPYYGWWQHYFSYVGRLRLRLMKRFDLPAEKLLINFMAADGSSISEAHSGLATWATLANPPSPAENGHQSGTTWQALYPGLFSRPEGPRPDLVIFGGGANERIDGPDEVAVYEGVIRWFQRHYPNVEFLVAMWNNQERYTRGAVMMRQLALRYGLPVIETGRELHLLTRNVEVTHLTPKDGHPQASAHDLWGRLLERAFQMTDPTAPGLPQTRLPERLSPYTVNWEGEMTPFPANSPRLRQKRAFIVEDAAFNVWATDNGTGAQKLEFHVDGLPSTDPVFGSGARRRPMNGRNERNSTLTLGRLKLGERHLVELVSPEATLVAVDMKTALNRRWHPVNSPLWEGKPAEPAPFTSDWGAPYGTRQLRLEPGQRVTLRWIGTLASVAWLQQPGGGTLVATSGAEPLRRPTGKATKLADGTELFMEDRGALPFLPYGVHQLEVTAEGGPVALLGAFTYDTRPNRNAERQETGFAAPGETIVFSAPYTATPVVVAQGGLTVESVSPESVTFGGSGSGGSYQVTGE